MDTQQVRRQGKKPATQQTKEPPTTWENNNNNRGDADEDKLSTMWKPGMNYLELYA